MAEMSYRYEDEYEDDDPTAELEILSGPVAELSEDDDEVDADPRSAETAAANQPFESERFDADLREANEMIGALSSELHTRVAAMKSIQLELDRLRSFSAFLEKEVESGKGIISDVTEELVAVRTEQNDVREQLRRREQQIGALRDKLAGKDAFISEFTKRVDTSKAGEDQDDCDSTSAPVATKTGFRNGSGYTGKLNGHADRKQLRMLEAASGGEPLRYPLISGRLTIGTGPANDVRLTDGFVSYRHAQITETSAGCVLKDLGSSNGTWVNGRRARWQVLRDGDVVDIGPLRFEFIDRAVELVDPQSETGSE